MFPIIPNRHSIIVVGVFIVMLIYALYSVLLRSPASEKIVRPITTEATFPPSCLRIPSLWKYDLSKISKKIFKCPWKNFCYGCRCYDPKLATREEQCPEPWALLDVTELRPPNGSIFFLETSCPRGRGVLLTYKQACSVESAARMHPHRRVYVLVVAPGHLARKAETWSPAARALLAYDNVHVVRLSFWLFVRGTPLQDLFVAGAMPRSFFTIHHASDLLRLLVLQRFGGVYLDLDFIVTKSLDALTNFAVAENLNAVANGALGFASNGFGQRIVNECIQDIRRTYECDIWSFNGPYAVTRALQRLCNVTDAVDMTEGRCDGFKVLPPSSFLPIPFEEWKSLFDPNDTNLVQKTEKAFAVHMWHYVSERKNVFLKSQQPYAQLARRFCPRIVRSAGLRFESHKEKYLYQLGIR